MTSNAGATSPGPLAEEAARLVDALSQWARGQAGAADFRLGDLADHVGGAEECRICPLCQLLALLRQTRPETFTHLLEAATAMTAALRSLAETAGRRPAGSPVTRIDLDDDLDPTA